jgi:hypothetical protein
MTLHQNHVSQQVWPALRTYGYVNQKIKTSSQGIPIAESLFLFKCFKHLCPFTATLKINVFIISKSIWVQSHVNYRIPHGLVLSIERYLSKSNLYCNVLWQRSKSVNLGTFVVSRYPEFSAPRHPGLIKSGSTTWFWARTPLAKWCRTVEASAGGLYVPEGIYSPVAKYFGTCLKIRLWIQNSEINNV